MDGIGRALVVAGVVILVIGLALMFAERVPFVGRLPGDITLRGDGWTVYAPLATSMRSRPANSSCSRATATDAVGPRLTTIASCS